VAMPARRGQSSEESNTGAEDPDALVSNSEYVMRASDFAREEKRDFSDRAYGAGEAQVASYRALELQIAFEGALDCNARTLLREGPLLKTSRDGQRRYHFLLFTDALVYARPKVVNTSKLELKKIIDTEAILVLPVPPGETHAPGTFRLMSRVKSFYVCAGDEEGACAWMEAISAAAQQRREQQGTSITENNCAIIPAIDDATACHICTKSFGFLSRKEFCGNCGNAVCASCATEKLRIPRLEDKTLFKVCSNCAREIKSQRQYGVRPQNRSPQRVRPGASAQR